MNNVGIVMLTWNHRNFTELCLDSIFKYTDKKYPILLIDQGSTDSTLPYLRGLKQEGKIELIELEKNIGIGPGYNVGINYFKDMDVCLVSNDIVVGYNWLEALKEGVYKDDIVGAASPFIAPEATYDNFCNMEFRQNYRSRYWPRLKNDPPVEELRNMLDEIHGGNFDSFTENWAETRKDVPPLYEWFSMLIYLKRNTIKMVGLFDECFSPSNWEDMDLIARLNNNELYRISVTGSYVFHWSNITNRNEWQDNEEQNYRQRMRENEARFHKKWRIFLPPDQVKHGIEDGDKYPPKEVMPFLPFEVSDSEHNRHHNKWYTWAEWNKLNEKN